MAKHCTNCGHELRETDKFCSECGTPVGGVAVPQPQPQQYEICEIGYRVIRKPGMFKLGIFRFTANAIGPKGTYVADESPDIDLGNNDVPWSSKEMRWGPAHDDFIGQLTAQGWEPLPNQGPVWYNYKFRRPVRS